MILMLTLPFNKAAAKGLLVKSPLNSACIAPISVLLRERERERGNVEGRRKHTNIHVCDICVCVCVCMYIGSGTIGPVALK